MTSHDFVHLHVHSEYSLLDGANRIRDLVAACERDGQRALALTDHGNMFGAIELYQTCREAGVKPIIGCEVYVAKTSRLAPHNRTDNRYHHLTLLARDAEGHRNLMKLASIAYLEGLNWRPRIDKQVLARHARGISCLSGCLAGEINQLFLRGDEARAEAVASEFRDLFGKEHFWLELQRNGIDIQDKANEALVRLGARTGIPLVATNDIHYLRHEDCAAQDVLLCINTGAKRADAKRFKFETDSLYFRTREEMSSIFRDLPQTVPATLDVADQVDLEIEFGTYHVPLFTPPDGSTPEQLFDRLCEEGLCRLYTGDQARARERLAQERRVIVEMGFVSYFLIVWDLINWARDHGIPVGPGRGSAAGSIVAYCLGITRVDPLQYDLLFERFLNSARVSMPDIDIDFCKEGRERVLQYTRERYGVEHVAQIVTFGTMASRTVVRDVGRALDVPLKDVDRIAKKIPAGPGAPSLGEAIAQDPDLLEIRRANPGLEELFQLSVKLEGMARHISTHAAGVVIADRPIVDYVPLCTHGDDVATQWPAPQLEALGLVKMDYLGLRTLTILARTLEYLERQGTRLSLEHLPPNDPATYRLLTAGDTEAVFQLESEGMRKLLMRLRPDCFEDLIAVLALYRPGPLESGMIDMFIRRKHGQEAVTYQHEVLRGILEDTYGCIVYQEQVMLISNHLAGFSLNEADNLRKAMGKKKPEVMRPYAEQFVAGAIQAGCSEATAKEIWENIVKFGGYGFNKSHSTAYAMITYQTAYLKANHRTAFMVANLSCELENSDKVKVLIDDAKRAGIAVRGPDITRSGWHFEPEDGAIRFGFGAIKGTGERAIAAMVAARADLAARGQPLTLHGLCRASDPQAMPRTCWEALIKAGCFDAAGLNRGALLAALDGAMNEAVRAAQDRRSGQGSLFAAFDAGGASGAAPAGAAEVLREAGAFTRSETLKAEKEVLGFYLTGHPLEERAGLFSMLSTVKTTEIVDRPGGAQVTLAGLIVGLSESLVKSGSYAGRKMARFRLEDLEGGVQVVVFPRTFEEQRGRLADDTVVVVQGKVEEREEPGLILEQVLTVEEALQRFEGGLVVHIEPEDQQLLPRLKQTLLQHKGPRPVYLTVRGSDGHLRRIRAGGDLRVAINADLTEEVDRLLGRGRVKLARL
jgi:DNA polymerase-3 subunit alpha